MTSRGFDALIADAQGGDRAALEAVCAAVRPPVLASCRRLLPDRFDAEDAVQETLVVVSHRIASSHGGGSFMGWVYAIAGREAARVGSRRAATLELIAHDLDAALLHDHEGLSDPEWRSVEQEVHAACTVAVVALLGDVDRLVYVLGDLLGVSDRRGSQLVGPSGRQPGPVPVPDALAAKATALGVLARAGALPAAATGTDSGERAA